jgi:hypothetical protein
MPGRLTDDTPSIVAADLFPGGRPRDEPVVVRWVDKGGGEVEVRAFSDGVECRYGRRLGGEPEEVRYLVDVSWTSPNFGGRRPWLHCARPSCGRRVGRLFLADPYLVCRQCAGVEYASRARRVPRHARRVERAKAIRLQLGGRPVLGGRFPPRPKGMHHATYARLRDEVFGIERAEAERIIAAIHAGEISHGAALATVLREQLGFESPSRGDR